MKKFYPDLRQIQIKTGIWTVVIILVLICGYLWLNGTLNLNKQQELKIAFDDVMGLEIGDKVMYRGMEVGRVKSIKAQGEKIICAARISSDIILKEGSRFSIADSSLMGGKALMIYQGEGLRTLNVSQTQTGDAPEGVMSLVSKASNAIQEMQEVLFSLKAPQGLIENSNNLINSAGNAVKNTESLAGDLKKDINQTLGSIAELSHSMNQLVQESRSPLNTTLAESPATLQRINSTLDSLQTLSSSLQGTANALNSGEGTAGKLLTDKQLYDRLSASVENLDALVKDIKANPKKYVKFSLF